MDPQCLPEGPIKSKRSGESHRKQLGRMLCPDSLEEVRVHPILKAAERIHAENIDLVFLD